jgi:hypothetical protein
MTDIAIMDTCIKASWVIKWVKHREILDYGSKRVLGDNDGDIERITWGEISQRAYKGSWPVLKGWMEYKMLFYKKGINILGGKLFNNTGLGERGGMVENEVFERGRRNRFTNLNIRVKECLTAEYYVKDKEGLEQILRTNINMVEFFRLRGTLGRLTGNIVRGEGGLRNIRELLLSKKPGGGILRRYITKKWDFGDEINVGIMKKMQNENLDIRDEKIMGNTLAIWCEGTLPADLRHFAFVYTQGRLLLNRALEIIDPENMGGCTFCTIKGEVLVQPEKHDHFFWDCMEVNKIRNLVREKTGIEMNKWDFWVGKKFSNVKTTKVWGFIMMKIKWYMNFRRIQRKLVDIYELKWEIKWLGKVLEKTKYRGIMEKIWIEDE